MKRLFIIFLALFLILNTGCSSEKHMNESSVSESSGYIENQQGKTTTSQKENEPITDERNDEIVVNQKDDVPSKENVTENPDEGKDAQSDQTVEDTSEKPSVSKEESLPEPTEPNPLPNNELPVQHDPPKTVIDEPAENEEVSDPPKEPNASAQDTRAVANKVIEYINSYRTEQGVSGLTKLSGLTEYAEYRSRQLVSNFAHNTTDERAAATALKYGQYVDPTLYGMTGEPYYTANAREAIAQGGYVGTIDIVAKNLAQLVRNSAGHWNYVGNVDYIYIAVGVTYESGMWYCDIALTRTNIDNT